MILPVVIGFLCALSAGIFIWSEYTWETKRTVLIKSISSLLFVAVGISGYLVIGASGEYGLWIIAALIFGMIGDVFLAFPDTYKNFISGLTSFLIGHVIYGIVFCKFNGILIYDIFIYVALVGISYLVYKKHRLRLGKMKIPALLYTLVIAFMFTMAVSSIYKSGFSATAKVLVTVGASFFAASDALLAFGRFGQKKIGGLRAFNLVLYYTGQILLGLSVLVV